MRKLLLFNALLVALFLFFLGWLWLRIGKTRRLYAAETSAMLADSRALQLVGEIREIAVFYDKTATGPQVRDYTGQTPLMTFREPGEIALFLQSLENGVRETARPPMQGHGMLAFVLYPRAEGAKPALMHGMLGGRYPCSVEPMAGDGQWDVVWRKAYTLFAFLKERGLAEAMAKPVTR